MGTPPLRALVLAPRGRDAALVTRMLADRDLQVVELPDPAALVAELVRGDVGVVILTQEACALRGIGRVAAVLDAEPDWSEVPIIVFVDATWGTSEYLGLKDVLGGRRNVTVLDRPVRPAAFRSIVAMAVWGRLQQFHVRDLLDRVNAFNTELQDRVDAQTSALRSRADAIEDLALALAQAEDRERERIAQLLHDDLQQLLYGIKIHFSLLKSVPEQQQPEFDRVGAYIDEALAQTRLLATEVHPVERDDGAAAALGRVVESARERYGLTVHLTATQRPVPPHVLSLVTRVARELLLNVVKHAGTMEAWVEASCDGHVCRLVVRDEGRGEPAGPVPGAAGRGLQDLRRRVALLGGEVERSSVPGEGTTVTVEVPVERD